LENPNPYCWLVTNLRAYIATDRAAPHSIIAHYLPVRYGFGLLFIIGSLVLAGHPQTPEQTTPEPRPPQLSVQEWRDDLHFLATRMLSLHKSLFHTMREADFRKAVDKLDAEIPELTPDQIFVRLFELMAMVQDGHTGFDSRPFPPPEDQKDHIPVRFDRYADGIYVRAAAGEYVDAVGGKLISVGGHDWKDAIQKVDSLESHDPDNNGEQLAWSAKTSLNWPRVLHGLGLSETADSADFLIEKNGSAKVFHMKASVNVGEWYVNSVPATWIDARPKSSPIPLSRQHEDKFYWFTVVPEHHAIYFQFNLVINQDTESLADFAARLASALGQPGINRLIIDLRNNTGGDNTLLRPLLTAIFRSKVNRRGGILAITGPTTFSAAQNFVNRLENYSEVIYIGEPTAENVNFYGDPAEFTLPHSHMKGAVSQLWWQDKDPRDKRTATFPEVALSSTFQDYLAGLDPVLQFALTRPTPETLGDALERELQKGLPAVLGAYKSYVDDPIHRYLPDPEARVNDFGYRLLSAKRFREATIVFEVNTLTHLTSANAFDSLGEAYMDVQDKPRALAAYRKSLELNPDNTNARQMIERLEKAK